MHVSLLLKTKPPNVIPEKTARKDPVLVTPNNEENAVQSPLLIVAVDDAIREPVQDEPVAYVVDTTETLWVSSPMKTRALIEDVPFVKL